MLDLAALYGVVLLTGSEAAKLLQSLVTCDVQSATSTAISFGALTTPKGRVLVLFRLIAIDDGYALIVPSDLVERTVSHLQLYKFRAKVAIADGRSAWRIVGEIGEPSAASRPPALLVVRDTPNAPYRWLLGPRQSFLESVPPANEASLAAWRAAEVAAGVPVVTASTAELFLPQHLNLEALGGLSFTKGCYPGQEVIARTQHLGTVKRRLARATAVQELVSGQLLRARIGAEERDGGQVVVSSGRRLLAVVPVDLLEGGSALYPSGHPEIAVTELERV